MPPGVQAVQNMCGKRGKRVFQAHLQAAEVYHIFQKKRSVFAVFCISQYLQNWTCKHKSLLAIYYGKKWFKFRSSNSKTVGYTFFLTPHIFANGPHLVALTQLQATKTRSKFFSIFFLECWVRKDFLGVCPEKFSHQKFSGAERFTKKIRFSRISLSNVHTPKKVSGSCTHNFDATDLPYS